MSLPAKGTRGRVLIEYLASCEPQQIDEVMTALSESLTRASVRAAVKDMYARGLVNNLTIQEHGDSRRSLITDTVALSQSARYELDDEDEEKVAAKAASLVPPRVVNVMTGPQLHPSKFLNPKGTREGSDWSQFPSRQL